MFSQLSKREIQALSAIRQHLVNFGKMPSIRELMRKLDYKSPRSVAVIIKDLEEKGILSKKNDGSLYLNEFELPVDFGTREQTVKIPLLGEVSCGLPIFAEENIEAEVPVSIRLLKKGFRYFLLRAKGDSMNKAGINDGDLVLIRQQQHAENGDKVVALINDEATIKEYHHSGSLIVLKPRSDNKKYQPIILSNEFRIQGVVETVISI
ncbi:MAG: repressor LexA [Flavobacteriia bacterium]|nr:MAG: repressor LexA [Flavobacteriia bacterium]